MKKLLLTFTVLSLIAVSTYAQAPDSASKRGVAFSVGLEAGFPVGDISNIYGFVLGGSVKLELPTAPQAFFTLSAGYNSFMVKGLVKDALGISSTGFIPLKAGLKYYASQGFYLEGAAGIVFSTESGGGHAFAFSPGLGYTLGNGLELGIKYEGWSNEGTTGQIAARIAYRFR